MADNALERSKHAEKELIKAMGEVEELFKQVNSTPASYSNCATVFITEVVIKHLK